MEKFKYKLEQLKKADMLLMIFLFVLTDVKEVKMKKGIFTFITLSSLFFMGCKSEKKLEGDWKVNKLVTRGTDLVKESAFINLKLEHNIWVISGNAGVNSFFGNIKIENGEIVMNDLALTKMMGDPESQHFEDEFIRVLMKVTSYELLQTEDNLVLYTDNQNDKICLYRCKY